MGVNIKMNNSRLGTQRIPASSLWTQLGVESKVQAKRVLSSPVHRRSSKWIGPVPAGKGLWGPPKAVLSAIVI